MKIGFVLMTVFLAACGRESLVGPYNEERGEASLRRRAAGTPPLIQLEGRVVSVTAGKLVVAASTGGNVEVALTESTVIRHGNRLFTWEDLEQNDRVHVKATVKEGVRTAIEVKLQNGGDGDGEDQPGAVANANGIVQLVGASDFQVLRANGEEVRVQVDAQTELEKKGKSMPFSELKAGDRVEAHGVRVDATTILAKKVNVKG